MKPQILIYGLRKGETERYMEELLAESCKSQRDIDNVIAAASKDGFHSFRITKWDGSAPNFMAAIQARRPPEPQSVESTQPKDSP